MEILDSSGELLGVIDNFNNFKEGLSFYGKESDFIQVATFKYNKNSVLGDHRHIHRPGESVIKTQEILCVWKGAVELRVFDLNDSLIKKHALHSGDFYICFNGGCGYVVLEDETFLLEAKTGPFPGSSLDRVLI